MYKRQVLHLSDPAEGSGYTYTHDLGIQGMQQNLGLSDDQIVRKINVSDSDEDATKQAIQECIDEGCNIIFATSWGYMEATAEMAEEYPDVYFSHGTGYMSNGRNFNNYFGRIYQARYLSGIVAVSYTHLRAHETRHDLVCRLLLEKKKDKTLSLIKNTF